MSNITFDYTGYVCVVTGASSGIGKATAQMFLEAGAHVALVDIDPVGTEALVAESNGKALFMQTDVSDPDAAARATSTTLERFQKIDILVNCAGIEYNDRGNLLEMPYDDLKRILDVNMMGYIHMARSVVSNMSDGGRVINVSSIQGLAAHHPGTSYQIAKSAILGLTHSLAIELAPREITVNTVAPGAIRTEGMGAVRIGDNTLLDSYRRRIPAGRRGTSTEVAGAILFLVSDLAQYITGTTLVVDGGYLIKLSPNAEGDLIPRHVHDPDR